MRKYLYLITEHPMDDRVGKVEMSDTIHYRVEKNTEGAIDLRNIDTGDRTTYMAVGLGYEDFDDGDDYRQRCGRVIRSKLREIDAEHLDKAGLELDDTEATE